MPTDSAILSYNNAYVYARPVHGGYREALWFRNACRAIANNVDSEAFRNQVITSHGVIGTVRHGYWEFVATTGYQATETIHNSLCQHINRLMRKHKEGLAENLRVTIDVVTYADRLMYDCHSLEMPSDDDLEHTLETSFEDVICFRRPAELTRHSYWPFEARQHVDILENTECYAGDKDFLVGACFVAPESFGLRSYLACLTLAQLWSNDYFTEEIACLRRSGSAYSYMSTFSRDSCTLCFGVFVPAAAHLAGHRTVHSVTTAPLDQEGFLRACAAAEVDMRYAGPLDRAIQNATLKLQFDSTRGFMAEFRDLTVDDCNTVLRWPKHPFTIYCDKP